MSLRTVDLRCILCAHEVRDELVDIGDDESITNFSMMCPKCEAADMKFFWPLGTRIAMFGEENAPKEMISSAQDGIVRTQGRNIEPLKGSTRSELKQWMKKNNLDAMAPDEAARGKSTMNTKTKYTKTREFEEEIAATVIASEEIVKAGGDRLNEIKQTIQKPNEYDVNTFKQQVPEGVGEVAEVAEELAPTE